MDGAVELCVSLPSGTSTVLSAARCCTIRELKRKVAAEAESSGQVVLTLVAPDGCVLEEGQSVEAAGLHDGDTITAIKTQAPQMAATTKRTNLGRVLPMNGAFATCFPGCNLVVAWGDPEAGGDCSRVQEQLQNVQQIQATDGAFAAILADGSVVTWGHEWPGGDSRKVQAQLRHVKQIQATATTFAAIRADGSVVTWGGAHHPKDVQDQLRKIHQIQSSH